MNILITGATGFIGRYLVHNLFKHKKDLEKIIIVSRDTKKARRIFKKFEDKIDFSQTIKNISAVEKISAIVNLAGEPIANKKWSKKQKNKIKNSRIEKLEELDHLIEKLRKKPDVLITASAVGYYGCNTENIKLNEDDEHQNYDFSHILCQAIEEKTEEISKNRNIRTCSARFGIALGKNEGALKKMLPSFKFGLGGKIGSGKQFMSWIHIHDLIYALRFIIYKSDLSGPVNITSPNAVNNSEFSKKVAKSLNRPALFNMPEFLVNIIFGEMGHELLSRGQNVYPKKLLDSGFEFKYENLDEALNNVLK